MVVTLLTNSTLITAANARQVAEAVSSVQISIDGATEMTHDAIRGTGSFRRALKTIRLLSDFPTLEINVSMCLMSNNRRDTQTHLPELLRALPNDVNVRFGRIKSIERTKELSQGERGSLDLERFVEQAVESGWWRGNLTPPERYDSCGFAHTLAIEPNGSVYPCPFPFACLGNICNDNPESLLAKAAAAYRAHLVDEYQQCSECIVRNICGGQCRHDNLKRYGGLQPNCDVAKQQAVILDSIVRGYLANRQLVNELNEGPNR